MAKRGRPTKYEHKLSPEKYSQLTELGATDEQVAKFFDVTISTIYEWKKAHPEFSDALKEGKKKVDDKVVESLFKRAMGYSHEAVKIFNDEGTPLVVPYTEHYPPDPTSMIFWLKNRNPKEWRDKQEHEHTGNIVVNINRKPKNGD